MSLDHSGIRQRQNLKVGDESYFETIISGVMFIILIGIVLAFIIALS